MPRKSRPQPRGVLAKRTTSDGRRRISLTSAERREIQRSEMIEGACVLFLDTTQKRTWTEIAEELGITLEQLKTLTRSEEFEEKYDLMFAELGRDPRYRAAQGKILDLIPLGMKRLEDLLISEETPPTVLLNAIKALNSMADLKVPPSQVQSDRAELAEFLVKHEHEHKFNIPEEYTDALKEQANAEDATFETIEIPNLD